MSEEEKATTRAINQDERQKIANKPTTLLIHKELLEIHDRFKELSEVDERNAVAAKRLQDEKLAAAVKEAEERGVAKGREESETDAQAKAAQSSNEVLSLIKFLRLAGYRRSMKSDNAAEDDAIERVLVQVYSGDDIAMEAARKLASASEDAVPQDESDSAPTVTCRSTLQI